MASEDKPKLRLHKKLKIPYCKEHGNLVFNDSKERLVVGRLENDVLVELDDITLTLCDQYGEQYDKSLVTEEAPMEEQELPEGSVDGSDVEEPPKPQVVERPPVLTAPSVKSDVVLEQKSDSQSFATHLETVRKTVLKALFDLENATQAKVSSLEKSVKELEKKLEEATNLFQKEQSSHADTKKKLKGMAELLSGSL